MHFIPLCPTFRQQKNARFLTYFYPILVQRLKMQDFLRFFPILHKLLTAPFALLTRRAFSGHQCHLVNPRKP
jgi:hypothetical protein